MHKLTLPNGEDAFYLRKGTVLSLYEEIFNNDDYGKFDIKINDGDIIFDVGANIGLVSRYFAKKAKNLTIYAFEPVPAIYEVLEANLGLITTAAHVQSFNIGLGDTEKSVNINYYPAAPAQSAIIPVDFEERNQHLLDNYKEVFCKMVPAGRFIPKFLRPSFLRLLKKMLYKTIKVPVQIRSLSAMIAEIQTDRIHLLKLDAENYDIPILNGINDRDWGKIDQIAMEVHTSIKDGERELEEIRKIIESKGYAVMLDTSAMFSGIGSHMLYAKKN